MQPDGSTKLLSPTKQRAVVLLFYLTIAVWVLFLLIETMSYSDIEDRALPTLAGGATLLLLVVELRRLIGIRYKSTDNQDHADPSRIPECGTIATDKSHSKFESSSTPESEHSKQMSEENASILALVFLFPILAYAFGFLFGSGFFVFIFVFWYKRDAVLAIKMTVIVLLGYYVLFILILDVFLWEGIWNPVR